MYSLGLVRSNFVIFKFFTYSRLQSLFQFIIKIVIESFSCSIQFISKSIGQSPYIPYKFSFYYYLKYLNQLTVVQNTQRNLSSFFYRSIYHMYNFLTKPQFLPISKTTNVHHFYQFQGKQLYQKKLQQKKQLDEHLSKIQLEEIKEKQNKSEPLQIPDCNNNNNFQPQARKSYQIDKISSNHSSKPNHPKSTRSFKEFYQKNKKWKQNLQAQLLKKKQLKIQQEQRQLSECRKPLSQQNSKFQNSINQSKNINSLHHAFQSKGPISGWTQRFHEYINKRLPQYPQVEYKPTINKKSKMIARRMVGKVEDRLIKFGEIMKMRKHQTLIEETGKIGKLPGSQTAHLVSTQTNHSDLFFRLYKQGQKTNRRVKQQQQRKQFSFHPQISKLPDNLQKRVQQKRQRSPLYTTKKFSKQQTHRLLQMYRKETGKTYSQAEFQNFIKRNQLLLEKRSKVMEQKVKMDMMREEKEFKECTFIPLLNPKSVRISGNCKFNQENQVTDKYEVIHDHQVTNSHVDYEYSHDDLLEDCPSRFFTAQLKPTSKKSTHLKPKFSYPHSYTEPNQQFSYQMKTPSKHELQNLEFSKSPVTHKNDMSEMDSLQFSGRKRQNLIMDRKRLESQIMDNMMKNNYVDTDGNEVVNYELTFSNTKLAHELSEIHHLQEQDQDRTYPKQGQYPQPQPKIIVNQNYTKQHHISYKTQRELSGQKELHNYNKKKQILENSWENELQKVKHRLQSLMNGSSNKNDSQKQCE